MYGKFTNVDTMNSISVSYGKNIDSLNSINESYGKTQWTQLMKAMAKMLTQ